MRVASSTRAKIPVKPGFSQLDWLRRHTAMPMPRIRPVKMGELALHKSRAKVWTSVRGLVYDVSAYVDYHPGGDKLMAAAGKVS